MSQPQAAAPPIVPSAILAFDSEVAQVRTAFAGYLQQASEESTPLINSMGDLGQVWNPAERELTQATITRMLGIERARG